MSEKKIFHLKIIDSAVFVFLVIFLLSLSNSIFINQLGYYGALLLILIKWAITKENQFSKTGLEFALAWYILAEILSTIFSNQPSAAFHNLLKRALLIPIIYTTIASVNDYKRAKTFVKIYLGATIITVLIYIYFSAIHYLKDLYGTTESGPSIFQYPITASEIISFTVIFLFAFLVNEKSSIKNKIFLIFGFGLSVIALFSTYKRTGWMGAAFGILIILIMKKHWKLLMGGVALLAIFLLTQKNISEIYVYKVDSDSLKIKYSFKTDGKAFDSYKLDEQIIVSDYNNGLAIYTGDSLKYKIELPSAAIGFYHWKNEYYVAALMDTRFILLKKDSSRFVYKNEFYSSGYTTSQSFNNDFLYIIDVDSGLTVFTDPNDLSNKIQYPQYRDYTNVFVDSLYIMFAESKRGFVVCKLSENLPTDELVIKDSSVISFFYYSSPFVFTVNAKGMNIYEIKNDELILVQNIGEINNIFKMVNSDGIYLAGNTTGLLYFLEQNPDNKFFVTRKLELGFTPKSFSLVNEQLLITQVESKQSRLLEIFDPYHPSNANRISFWRAGIGMFMDHPIFGVGDIDLQNLYRQYKRPFDKEIQGHLHNNFFHVLATLGLFGLLAVLFLFYKIIVIEVNIYKAIKDKPFVSSYALGALAAFCGFIISGLTELNFWDHEITTLIWFTFGLNIALFRLFKPDTKTN